MVMLHPRYLPLRLLLAIPLSLVGLGMPAQAEQSRAVILQYQQISDSQPRKASTSPANFQRQMRYLRDKNYRVLPLPDIVQHLRDGKVLPDRSVAITFDGADRSVCETVFPLLNKLQIPFTVFVNSAAIDSNDPAACSWAQLQQLAAAGVTLANHMTNRKHLVARARDQKPADWRAAVQAEIEQNEQRILEQTGQSHRLLAWPHGEFNEATKEIARAGGYAAFGEQSGPIGVASDFQELPRFVLAGSAGADSGLKDFALLLETLPFPLESMHKPDNPLTEDAAIPTLEFVLRASGSNVQTSYRRRLLNCFDSNARRISSTWLSDTRFRVKAYHPLPLGRSRYICTLPADNGRVYWYSSLWIRADKNGRWPD